MANTIIHRKDFHKVRQRVLKKVRVGKCRAEVKDDKRIDKIVSTLMKQGLKPWTINYGDSSLLSKAIEAVMEEYGGNGKGMHIDEVHYKVNQVMVHSSLQYLIKRGKLCERRDSYGRRFYSAKGADV